MPQENQDVDLKVGEEGNPASVKLTGTGEAGPAMLFIFTMLTVIFLGMYTGFFPAPDSSLMCGLIMLACFPAYLYGGISYIQKGDTISGCCYLIFATCFGGIGCVSNLVTYYAAVNGLVINQMTTQLVWLWSGIILIPIVAAMRKGPSLPFIVFALGALELTLMGLIGLGFLPAGATVIVLVCFVIVGFGGFYVSIAQLFAAGGINIPLGKPLMK